MLVKFISKKNRRGGFQLNAARCEFPGISFHVVMQRIAGGKNGCDQEPEDLFHGCVRWVTGVKINRNPENKKEAT